MSLDVYLTDTKKIVCDCGKVHKLDTEEVFEANITHNLNKMADEAGIYQHLWRPEELGISHAKELIQPIEKALNHMKANQEQYEKFNSPNGWGMYEHFVPWIESYLEACKEFPDAVINVSR